MEVGSLPRCAELSQRVDEPLAGTAPHAERWVCVEHAGPWTRTLATDPDPAIAALARRCGDAEWKLTVIHRPGQRGRVGRRRVYLAETARAAPRLSQLVIEDLRDLALDVAQGDPVTEPLLLMCGHGGRDRCCVLDGRPLAAALADAGQDVWECSHLGGHRFAPTAVVLPTGYVYGRLDVPAALAAYRAATAGEMDLVCCRGRSTWPVAGQIAELAVRAETGIRDAAALDVHVGGNGGVEVRHVDGAAWQVRLSRKALAGARPSSCGEEPKRVSSLIAGAVERIV